MTKSEIFEQLFSFGWPNNTELTRYALDRHGYCGDDGYYGVTYPSDLDEYQREVEGEFIPEGYVEIIYWDGQHKEIQCKEEEYLAALESYLNQNDCGNLVKKLKRT